MNVEQNLSVQILFIKSAEDEDTLRFAVPDAVFEFHVQQALEKLLKALIAACGESFPFTHNLEVLTDQLRDLGVELPSFSRALQAFTKFGVLGRYDLGTALSGAEREEFRTIVRELREFVTTRVAELP